MSTGCAPQSPIIPLRHAIALSVLSQIRLHLSKLVVFQHIDQIMSSHGKQIMQAVTLILEGENSMDIKEQVGHSLPSYNSGDFQYDIEGCSSFVGDRKVFCEGFS